MKNKIRFGYWKDGKKRALSMSYDDGRQYDRQLVEIFNRYGIKGTFHLNSAKFGMEDFVTAEEVASLYQGHEVSCHTATHPFLERIPQMEVVNELLSDRIALESLCGYPVRGMSYPYGTYSASVINTLRGLGMHYSRTTQATNKFTVPEDFMLWHPTCHHTGEILKKLESFRKAPNFSLFYVWGHSYEFPRDNNWDMIETFCREASGDGDVWYATNIELYDYVSALRALDLSADGTMVYNPSATDVWLDRNGEAVLCPAGNVTRLF